MNNNFFEFLTEMALKPKPYAFYTAEQLWNDEYISKKMLEAHLTRDNDWASRNKAFFDAAVQWIETRFAIGCGTKIIDFGCGPGFYAERFARAGAEVTAVDFSVRSIEYARKSAAEKQLSIDYVLQDYLMYETDKTFDLILLVQRDYTALPPEKRKCLLDKFHSLLAPGGAVLLDVFSELTFEAAVEGTDYARAEKRDFWSDFWSAKPYIVFNMYYKYETEKLLLNKHVVLEKERTLEIFNWLQCFNRETLRQELNNSGLRLTEVYADITGAEYNESVSDFAVVATL